MALSTGTRLGHYEVTALLGAGGMGEVYRARDSRLGREVAIKVLPGTFTDDTDRLRRFEQEARAAGALNHPNVTAVFDIGTHEGSPYLVLELLEGETLRAAIAGGRLPVRRAVEWSVQIALGLAAAHERGIVHRDLKPENVFITRDGRVKILDFGLAKVVDSGGAANLTGVPTAAQGTEPGVVLGTLGYMSPEQVRGRPADARSDIFSFGAILYEMLSGQRAFKGDSAADTMSAILREDPPEISLSGGDLSPGLLRTVRHCLEKSPEARFQSARDVAFALESLVEPSSPRAAPGPAGPQPTAAVRRNAGTSAVVVAVALVAGATGWMLARRRAVPVSHVPVVEHVARLTHEPGLFESPTYSPDGSFIAYSSNKEGNYEIYVRRADGGEEVNVTKDPHQDIQPSFSPDGRELAFISTRSTGRTLARIGGTFGIEYRILGGGDLWVTPVLGGRARRVAEDASYPVYTPDGRSILYVSGPEDRRTLAVVPAEGGAPRELLKSADSAFEIVRPSYLTGGAWIAFEEARGRVYLMPASGGTPRKLADATGHAWGARELYLMQRESGGGTRIERAEFDPATGTLAGKPEVVWVTTGYLQGPDVSPDGKHIVVGDLEAAFNVARIPLTPDGGRTAGPEEVLTTGAVRERNVVFTPKGDRLVFGSDRAGPADIWMLNIAARALSRVPLPSDDLGTYFPQILPDGNRFLASRFRTGGPRSIWLLALDGSEAREVLASSDRIGASTDFSVSPDGRSLFVALGGAGRDQLYAIDIATGTKSQVTSSAGDKYDGVYSRDGRSVAYVSNATGALQVYVMPTAGGPERRLTDGRDRIRHLSFSPDGKFIYYQPNHGNIFRVPAGGGAPEQVTTFQEAGLFLEEPTLSPDGRWLAYSKWNGGSSLWILTLSGKPARGTVP